MKAQVGCSRIILLLALAVGPASLPGNEPPSGAGGPVSDPRFANAAGHWAFQLPVRPAVPAAGNEEWELNPIDAFVAAKHREHGLEPNAPASRPVLLRRIYFDLIGLPPTTTELRAFLEDESAGAYEKVVDRLLESPQYGERWGRHWMDVWRYSDNYGNEGNGRITHSHPHIWRWRDWIVESLNADKGYDRMILEMLAGDEIAPSDPDILRATGFLARNHFRLDRNVPLTSSLEHSSRAFLGLTLECARCHEHKYDPFSQEDYYRLRAVFEPMAFRIDRVPGEPDTGVDGLARVYDASLDIETFVYEGGDERRPIENHPVAAALPEFFEEKYLDGQSIDIVEVPLAPEEYNPWLRPYVGREEIARLESEIERLEVVEEKSSAKLKNAGELLDGPLLNASGEETEAAKESVAQNKAKLALARIELATHRARLAATRLGLDADRLKFSEPAARDGDAFTKAALEASAAQRTLKICQAEEAIYKARQKLDDLNAKLETDKSQLSKVKATEKELADHKEALEKAIASKPTAAYEPLGEIFPEKSTGRRTAFARWLSSDRNPLTARVAVNQIWMRHFGEPLVPMLYEFGLAGRPPTHPALLDWLAVEFVEHGWSIKHLHRLMVTSNTYRMSSSNAGRRLILAVHPDNRYLWRMNPRRMEAEVVRDSMLHLAGELDLAQGGPEIPVEESEKVLRRSLYFKHSGAKQVDLLELFDGASIFECYRRPVSIVPQQALALSNSALSLKMARLIASDLAAAVDGSDSGFIDRAFERVLTRLPTWNEKAQCKDFLLEQAMLFRDSDNLTSFSGGAKADVPPSGEPAQRARENLVHVLLNHNDYVTIR